MHQTGYLIAFICLLVGIPQQSFGYIAVSAKRLTLSEVMLEFPTVMLLTLDKNSLEKGAYLFSVTETLQGQAPKQPIRHAWFKDGKVPPTLAMVKPGDQAVTFMGSPDNRSLTLIAGQWFITKPNDGWERLDDFRDDFNNLYFGDVKSFADAVRTLRRGGNVTVQINPKTAKPTSGKFFVRYEADYPHRRFPAVNPSRKGTATIAEIKAALASADPAIRQQGTVHLPKTDATLPEVTKLLLERLQDDHPEVRIAAAYGLGIVRNPDDAVVKALTSRLDDEDRFACGFAAWALGTLGEKAKSAVPKLLAALADRNFDYDYRPHRAAEAAEAILRITSDADATDKALALFGSGKMLQFDHVDSEGTRTAAARALGRIGTKAKPMLPALTKRLKDPVAATRIACAEAILKIGTDERQYAEPDTVLLKELGSKNESDCIQALKVVQSLNRRGLLPEVKKLESHPIREVNTLAKQVATEFATADGR